MSDIDKTPGAAVDLEAAFIHNASRLPLCGEGYLVDFHNEGAMPVRQESQRSINAGAVFPPSPPGLPDDWDPQF